MGKSKQIILPDRYHLVPRSLTFIINQDEILLLKGSPDKKIWAGLYNGIGGHIERGENVLEAAKRELFEETGIQKVNLTLRANILIDVEENQGISLFVFLGKTTIKTTKSSSEGEIEWIKINELANYPLVEDLHQLIPRIISEVDNIIFGRYFYHNDNLIMQFT